MNNKGFTLIELLTVIILLSLVMSITAVSAVNIINTSKNKSYELLVKNIKIGAQEYFEECENKGVINSDIDCTINDVNIGGVMRKQMAFTLGDLLKYGFLTSSDSENDKIENPKSNKNIKDCSITITKDVDDNFNVSYDIENNSVGNVDCPTTDNYNNF